MFDKIVAVILPKIAWSTIPYVRYLATNFGSEVHLLGLSTQPLQVLESLANNLREENIVTITNFIRGNPAVETAKYVKENGITLLVIASGTCNEITYAILNNVTKGMGSHVNIPVLTVPIKHYQDTGFLGKAAFLKILVPLDCSEVGEAVLPYVEAVAKKVNGSITLLNVNTPPFRGVPIMHSEVIRMSRAAGRDFVKRVCERIEAEGVQVNFEVIDGTPVKTILRYATQNNVDLIAMATRGLRGINRVFGSVTNGVTKRAEVPVLAVGYASPEAIGLPTESIQ